MPATVFVKRPFWAGVIAVAVVAGILMTPAGRSLAQRWLSSLRVQKVQAVNVDLSPFTDPNANPALHQMVAQMVSGNVDVTLSEKSQPAADAAAATRMTGFPVQLLSARKDAPTLVVGGQRALNMKVDRNRLQEIVKAAGHPEIVLPDSLDGASLSVRIPRSVHARYGTCPGPITATNALANQVIAVPASSSQFVDCVRLSEGPAPVVNVPGGLDVKKLAEIGLQVAGMTQTQADQFFETVDWKSTLTLPVPRQLRSYEQVKVGGAPATLLTLAGRRGPGYTLIWASHGIAYALTGYGDSSRAVGLADSLK